MEGRNRIQLLVMGARPGSLGEAIMDYAIETGWDDDLVVSAGMTDHEDVHLNVLDHSAVSTFFLEHDVSNVICTVGVNRPVPMGDESLVNVLAEHYWTNVVGIAHVLQCWKKNLTPSLLGKPKHFAVLSSNSAHIARRTSAPYCASKAALSMLLRVAAREWALDKVCVYGWEPGMIEDTPMTREVFGHRIPSGEPLRKRALAKMIIETLNAGIEINGCLFRVDGGEQ